MENLARQIDPRDVSQEVGSITRAERGTLVVRTSGGEVRARRSASCLIAPQPGDSVIVACLPSGGAYVLAVLERADASSADIAIEGDVRLCLPSGQLSVTAEEGVRISSGESVEIASSRLGLNAVDGVVALQRLSFVGRYVQSHVERLKTIAGSIDWVLDRFSQKVKRSYRTVEEYDHLRAECIDHRAERSLNLRGQSAMLTAEKLVKLDGEQIHVG